MAGEPLVAHVQRVVRGLSDDVVISCNRNQDRTGPMPTIWWRCRGRLPGPLAGVIAGLTVAGMNGWCCWPATRRCSING
jgi:molybdopterin-guanine dinucleotide biosynthesis protein A